MENEEGLNHLWVEIMDSAVCDVRIHIDLPEGLLRLPNLTGHEESDSGTIFLDGPLKERDVLVEFFTEEAVTPGRCEIIVVMDYRDAHNREQSMIRTVVLEWVEETQWEEIVINDDVAGRVKPMRSMSLQRKDHGDEWIVLVPPGTGMRGEMSELEKKYRIDY
ncbi:hypothetical protein [Paenibacillus nasutitermitis]|nr:hypothetical protein [Paenibacillus nasutitermitis]